MLDPRLLRTDLDAVRANLARRGFALDAAAFQSLEDRRKSVQVRVEELRGERNARSRDIGKLKASGQDVATLMAAVKALGDEQADLEAQRKQPPRPRRGERAWGTAPATAEE